MAGPRIKKAVEIRQARKLVFPKQGTDNSGRTAGNPERRIRAVVVDAAGKASGAARQLFGFTLANVKVSRFRNGTACYDYELTDARELAF